MRRFPVQDAVDFVVVGSGAAGSVLALELSSSGHTVVVLEQGPWLQPEKVHHDEFAGLFQWEYWNSPLLSPQTFQRTPDDRPVPNTPNAGLWSAAGLYYGRLVGGSNAHFTANYWRFHEIDFVERSRLGPIAGTGFTDWPITYGELEPYYTKAEWALGISGAQGPFDPPRSRPYPLPPLPVKSSGVLFERGARKLGLHPQPAPMAILSQPYDGRSGCMHCGFCQGYVCEFRAKSNGLSTLIPKAVATGRCEIRPESYVVRIETDPQGRARGVTYFDAERRERFQPARAVVLSANGAETPRLLLMSASSRFPNGLANGSGLVGKYLMFNSGSTATGVFDHPLNEFKSVEVTRIAHDFYDTDPSRGFYGGGGLDGRFDWQGPISYALWHQPTNGPQWGAGWKRMLRENFGRRMTVMGHSTSLPLESNAVMLDPELKDAWGMPAIRFRYRDHPDDLATARFFQDRGMEILDAAGASRAWREPFGEQSTAVHLLGTCRMGDDPATSVVDRYHRSHEVPNLFLCDGSSFVTSGRGQPSCTIQALAFRAADHISRFARRGEI
jgi:choline dehydrogenase-like flavoprotein